MMKRILSFVAMIAIVGSLLIPTLIKADDCCGDAMACEALMLEAGNQINELEEENVALKTTVTTLQNNPPDMPLNGLLQSFGWFRKLPRWAKVGTSGLLALGVLVGTTYIELEE